MSAATVNTSAVVPVLRLLAGTLARQFLPPSGGCGIVSPVEQFRCGELGFDVTDAGPEDTRPSRLKPDGTRSPHAVQIESGDFLT
jgi:hypothetical protein